MLIYRLDNDRLILVGDDSDENLAGLVQQPGVESALADGQCAVVSGAWVVPHVVTVANAPYADALDLDWSSETVATPKQIEYTITATQNGVVVKQSRHVQLLLGHVQAAPVPHLITTTKGPMLTSDLVYRSPADGVHEYWYPSADPPVSPLDRVETEDASGGVRYLELVHRSAVAAPC